MESLIGKFVITVVAFALGTFIGLMAFMATMILIELIG